VAIEPQSRALLKLPLPLPLRPAHKPPRTGPAPPPQPGAFCRWRFLGVPSGVPGPLGSIGTMEPRGTPYSAAPSDCRELL
jgi:hypothetical protein